MARAELHPVRIGCSGWNYASWRESLYPPRLGAGRWLEHYAGRFDTVEVNSTFYRLASREAVARWVTQTPSDFLFTLKASRYLTHVKRLTDLDRGIERFYERVQPLVQTPKMGPVLWQLPASFRRDDERLGAALNALPAGRHCFEFRHPSWFTEDVYELLRWHGVALVIGDRPDRPFQTHEMTADWTLVRFHHGHRGRRGNYSDSELAEWAKRIDGWRREVEVLAYFNNDWEVFAPRNAVTLRRMLERGRGGGPRGG
ncbi:MAG TPA: DUF72 domain-containing protein [Solirubrobacteraceae bacterium]|nr:DUF72 domain-containing protein [Solirubrobacteraceae bacterium]